MKTSATSAPHPSRKRSFSWNCSCSSTSPLRFFCPHSRTHLGTPLEADGDGTPGGDVRATFSTAASMTFPNVFNVPPGTRLNLVSFDHTTADWLSKARPTVSEDGFFVEIAQPTETINSANVYV